MNQPLAIRFCIALSLAFSAMASEYGRSTYTPGLVGDFSIAVLPEVSGFYLRTDVCAYSGKNTYTEWGGALDVDADLEAYGVLPRVTWVSGLEWLGIRHGATLSLPLFYIASEARVTRRFPGQAASTAMVSGSRLSFSDFYLTPAILEYKIGSWNVMWLETLCIPSGAYDSDASVNVSRNYFALNSSLATTWRHPDGGPEVDLRASYLVNAENPATDYRTGDELIIEGIAAWRFDTNWSAGLAGYGYEQITGDSGDGAIFGDFKGQSFGAGPLVRYIGTVGTRRIAWGAKWIHDIDATHRYQGDLLLLSVSLRF
ncbi:MAG: transporter [bacterium]